WRGNLFVGALAGQTLVRLDVDSDKVVKEERLLQQLRERIRDVRQGPDGALWLATDSGSGRVFRLAPAKAGWFPQRIWVSAIPTSCVAAYAPKITRDVIVPTRSFSTRPHPINERCPSGAAVTSPRDPSRVCAMFSLFERLLKPTDLPEQAVPPPSF